MDEEIGGEVIYCFIYLLNLPFKGQVSHFSQVQHLPPVGEF